MNSYDLSKETSSSIGKIVGVAAGAIITKLVTDWLSDDNKKKH